MKTIANPLSGLQLASRPGLVARLPDFITLMKPRVMMLAVFTALVGLASAPRELDPLHAFVAVLAITAGAGAAGVLNMWYDADIDAIMTRTAMRPIPAARFRRSRRLCVRAYPCHRRGLASGSCDQPDGSGAARRHDPFLCRCLHGLAEALHAPEHSDRRRCGRAAPGYRMGRGDRRRRPGAACSVPHHLSLDAAAFLGARAQSRRRICEGGCADAPGRLGKRSHETPDFDLQRSLGQLRCCRGRLALQVRSMARLRRSAEQSCCACVPAQQKR